VYRQITNSLPSGTEIPEWVRDPYISLATALEIAIENTLNLANIMATDTSPNPEKLSDFFKK
jgi:hypothetical protein